MDDLFGLFDFRELLKCFGFSVVKFKEKCLGLFIISCFETFFRHIIEIKVEKRNLLNSLVSSLYGLSKTVDLVQT